MRINSEYVMKPKEIFYFNKRFVIITKEMDYGSLDQILEHCNEYTENFVKYTVYMIARGIKDLHEHQILHRDIKTNNVLSNSLGEIKITDLGQSAQLHADRFRRNSRNVCTQSWRAPEIIKGDIYQKEIDIWSLGALCYELATSEPPFMEDTSEKKSVLM